MLGRKSLVVGALTSVGLVVADATRASAAEVLDPMAAVPKWAPYTQYAGGRQVISPKNDVVAAKVAHRSSAAYATDTAKWALSSSYALIAEPIGAAAQATANAAMATVNHGANPATARPVGAPAVYWVGTVEPANAVNGDMWGTP